ncbi:MAG: protein kinase [bacterium]
MTKAGTTLDAATYITPEQARGEEVDHRSDIWSFGMVLYEAISGEFPFHGDLSRLYSMPC